MDNYDITQGMKTTNCHNLKCLYATTIRGQLDGYSQCVHPKVNRNLTSIWEEADQDFKVEITCPLYEKQDDPLLCDDCGKATNDYNRYKTCRTHLLRYLPTGVPEYAPGKAIFQCRDCWKKDGGTEG